LILLPFESNSSSYFLDYEILKIRINGSIIKPAIRAMIATAQMKESELLPLKIFIEVCNIGGIRVVMMIIAN